MAEVADITRVVVPDEAEAGTQVTVVITVKNIGRARVWVAVTPKVDETVLDVNPTWRNLEYGEEGSFTSSFTMPERGVSVHVWSWYWAMEWRLDDYHHEFIRLKEPELQPTFGNLVIEGYQGK